MFTVKNAIIQKTAFTNLAKRDVSSKAVTNFLEKAGFKAAQGKGSHINYTKDGKRVTVPEHGKKDIPEGTLASIIRQVEEAGIQRKEFKKAIGRGR